VSDKSYVGVVGILGRRCFGVSGLEDEMGGEETGRDEKRREERNEGSRSHSRRRVYGKSTGCLLAERIVDAMSCIPVAAIEHLRYHQPHTYPISHNPPPNPYIQSINLRPPSYHPHEVGTAWYDDDDDDRLTEQEVTVAVPVASNRVCTPPSQTYEDPVSLTNIQTIHARIEAPTNRKTYRTHAKQPIIPRHSRQLRTPPAVDAHGAGAGEFGHEAASAAGRVRDGEGRGARTCC
jgi:hypothetical protein